VATFSLSINGWSDATVQQLVVDAHVESQTVEFKRELPFLKPSDKLEVAKDVSAMANASGGWIVYGIDERVGASGIKVAAAAVPLIPGSSAPHDGAHWIDDVIVGNVTPRPSYRVRQIPASGGVYIVVHVAPTADDLFMVSDGRFYRRSEQGARRMTEPEIRQAYALISRRREDARRYVREVVEQELASHSRHGFLIALVPHTFREMVDPVLIGFDDNAIGHLAHEYRSALTPCDDGVEARIADLYRFRIRRDGAVTLASPGYDDDVWFPVEVLKELLATLAVARRLWPRFGIIEPATVSLRARLPKALKTQTSMSGLRHAPLMLGPAQAFEIAVGQTDLFNAPLNIARAVMDRLYQSAGEKRCQLFKEDGTLGDAVAKEVGLPLRALGLEV
jgi:hypothetical protein